MMTLNLRDGVRAGVYKWSSASNNRGFRLNGVVRGGYYGGATVERQRCARRGDASRHTDNMYRGFRLICEGCIEGMRGWEW